MVEINLLPQKERRQSQPDAWKYAAMALPILTAAGILVPEIMTASTISGLNKDIEQLQGEITALTPAKNEFDTLSTEKRNLLQTTQIAQQLASSKTYWSNDIAAFTTQLPQTSGIAIQTLNMHPMKAETLATSQQQGIYVGRNITREIEIIGRASGSQAVVNFLNSYEQSPKFGVNFKRMQKDEQRGDYSFEATVGVVDQTTQAGVDSSANATTPTGAPGTPASGGQ